MAVNRYDDPMQDPHYGARVRMRVVSKVRKTSLPLAHDGRWTEGGSCTVHQGTSEIIVFEKAVPDVLAKVETDTLGLAQAHETFWRNATEAVREALKGTAHAAVPLPIPDVNDITSPNRWVDTKWQDPNSLTQSPAVLKYNEWLKGASEHGGSPQAIFGKMRGRGPLPLASAEIIPHTEPKDAAPPLGEERRSLAALRDASMPDSAVNFDEEAYRKAALARARIDAEVAEQVAAERRRAKNQGQ